MSVYVRDPDPDVSLPDARDNVNVYYTLTELDGATWISSPRSEEDYDEWFILKDGRTVCLYSIDLDYDSASPHILRCDLDHVND